MATRTKGEGKTGAGVRDRIVDTRRVRAGDLIPNPKNWRTHPKAQGDAMRGILAEIGYTTPLMAVETAEGLMLIDGHLRAETTPDTLVPVSIVDLTPAEADKVLATHDPLSAMAGRDDDLLRDLLATVETSDEAVRAMLASLAKQEPLTGLTDPDDVPEVPEPTTKPGDLWLLGEHRLLCGDSTKAEDVARLMAGDQASLIVTSPPYNQNIETFKPSGMQKENPAFVNRMAGSYADSIPEAEYQQAQIDQFAMIKAFLTPLASVFYNHKIRYRDKAVVHPMEWVARMPYALRQEIIWNRSGSITLNARMFMPSDERIYWLRSGDNFLFNDTAQIKAWSSVWDVTPRNDVSASAAFATEIPMRCIEAYSARGDVVLEPYSGSGTTLIACERLNRRCYAMEIEPKYVDVAVRRWEQFTGREATRA